MLNFGGEAELRFFNEEIGMRNEERGIEDGLPVTVFSLMFTAFFF